MKHTSNQKVVTAAIQKHSSKALFAPYRACTALNDRKPPHAVTIQNRGLWRVAVGILKSGKAALVILPISNRGITAGGYARPGSNLLPEILGTGRAALCFGNGYFRRTPDKRMRGSRRLLQSHYNKRVFGS